MTSIDEAPSKNEIHIVDDGSHANNPRPDWWEEKRLDSIGGRLFYTTIDVMNGCREKRELIDDAGRLAEVASDMGLDDDDLAKAVQFLNA